MKQILFAPTIYCVLVIALGCRKAPSQLAEDGIVGKEVAVYQGKDLAYYLTQLDDSDCQIKFDALWAIHKLSEERLLKPKTFRRLERETNTSCHCSGLLAQLIIHNNLVQYMIECGDSEDQAKLLAYMSDGSACKLVKGLTELNRLELEVKLNPEQSDFINYSCRAADEWLQRHRAATQPKN